jgi:hypothetical protein
MPMFGMALHSEGHITMQQVSMSEVYLCQNKGCSQRRNER